MRKFVSVDGLFVTVRWGNGSFNKIWVIGGNIRILIICIVHSCHHHRQPAVLLFTYYKLLQSSHKCTHNYYKLVSHPVVAAEVKSENSAIEKVHYKNWSRRIWECVTPFRG